jgi:hypothetical protein
MLVDVKVLIGLLAMLPGLARVALPEEMICIHRDGQVRVEPIAPACCLGEDEPVCPDEQCSDLPLVDPSPVSMPDAPLVLDLVSLPAPPLVVEFLPASIPTWNRPSSTSGPPPPGPERHLTTVVLRR